MIQIMIMLNNKRTEPRRRVTQKELLRYLGDVGKIILPLGKSYSYRMLKRGMPNMDFYFPYSISRMANQLERHGYVEKESTKDGVIVKINSFGKKKILKYNLLDLKPPQEKWDGKWRLVFFDVEKIHNTKRDNLRQYLKQIGMEMFQESVFISPYDISSQVQYLREILEIPHTIKIARLDWVENEEELKEIFKLK